MKRYSSIALLFSLITQLSFANSVSDKGELLLVGGGLKTCSSMAIKNCEFNNLEEKTQLKTGKQTSYYQINQKTINLFKKYWPEDFSKTNQQAIFNILQTINKQEKDHLWSKAKLKSLFKKYDEEKIIRKLNDAQYYFLLDALEQPVINENTEKRLTESVNLSRSSNTFSTEIYHQFITLAQQNSGKKRPRILVVTASARDPFEAVDFYQTVFTQAGGDTRWLPLDATLNALIQQTGERQQVCQQLSATRLKVQGSFHREYVYPDLVDIQYQACLSPESIFTAIEKADGIFINGGDQSLTLKAFIKNDGSDNRALTMIKEKLAKNSLVVGGTSAGTAVMSGGLFNNNQVAMITNGQSNTAIVRGAKKNVLPMEGCQKSNSCQQNVLNDDLTYNASGGLGLFTWGILDTHFSERGRQGRLAQLAIDTNTHFAFGVDESTALLVSNINSTKPRFEIVGQSGVFIVENKVDNLTKNSVLTHYLTRGDTLTFSNDQLSIKYISWKKPINEPAKLPENIDDIFYRNRYQQSAELLCRTNNVLISGESHWQNIDTQIIIKKQENAKSNFGTFNVNGSVFSYCSYQNYLMSFSKE